MKCRPVKRVEGTGLVPCAIEDATHIVFKFRNEEHERHLPVQIKGTRQGTGNWTWNGSLESPTLKPSIRTNFGTHVCHTFVNDGKATHLSDCTCGMAGITEPLDDIEEEGQV